MASIMLDALKGQLCSKLAGIMFTPVVGTIFCTLGLTMHKRILIIKFALRKAIWIRIQPVRLVYS